MTTNSTREIHHNLGGLSFCIKGAGPVFDYLSEELGALPVSASSEKTAITFELTHALPAPPPNSVSARDYTGWGKGFQVTTGALSYRLEVIDGAYFIAVQIPQKTSGLGKLKAYVRRFFNFNYLSNDEIIAKNFMYSLFNLITGQLLVMRGIGTYLHASSFERDGNGIALVASGGAGKTTSLLKLISPTGFRYLSDDIGLLDSDGFLIRTPLRMQVYAYNLKGDDQLQKRFFSSRGVLDRLSWHIRLWRKGDKSVRRRISAEKLFGVSSISVRAKLKTAIFLERVMSDHFSLTPITQEDFIWRINHIMPGEIGGLDTFSDSLELVGCGSLFLNRSQYSSLASEILSKSLHGITPLLLKVPYNCDPTELAKQITSALKE